MDTLLAFCSRRESWIARYVPSAALTGVLTESSAGVRAVPSAGVPTVPAGVHTEPSAGVPTKPSAMLCQCHLSEETLIYG